MTPRRDRFELPLRLLAAGITVASLGLMYALTPEALAELRVGTVFALVFATGTSFILIARSLGSGVAAGLGVVLAISMSLALANMTGAPPLSHAAFTLVATVLMLLVGRMAGSWDDGDTGGGAGLSKWVSVAQSRFQASGGRQWTARSEPPERPPVELTLGGVISDFYAWTSTEAARGTGDATQLWPSFARFVRQTLRERLQAREVRVFERTADGNRLVPLAASRDTLGKSFVADSGALGYAVQTGHVYVAARRSAAAPPRDGQHWSWVLPIKDGRRTCALIAIGAVDRDDCNRPSVGHAVRDLMQLCWAHVRGLAALHDARRTDTQTGLLNREELLAAMRGSATIGAHQQEPIGILTLTLEGLRSMDDAGRWNERDDLVRRLGAALREHLHTDDLLARFSDDRFVVVMQRTDGGLGRTVADLIIADLQRHVLSAVDPHGTTGVRLRAALTNGAGDATQREGLLAQALRLLDDARRSGVTLMVADVPATAAQPEDAR